MDVFTDSDSDSVGDFRVAYQRRNPFSRETAFVKDRSMEGKGWWYRFAGSYNVPVTHYELIFIVTPLCIL